MVIFSLEVVNKFAEEESERYAIGFAKVDAIEDFIEIANSGNDVDFAKSLDFCHLVINTLDHPTSLTIVGTTKVTFINIDYSDTLMQKFDELGSSILSLKFSIWVVLVKVYLLHLAISYIQLSSQITSEC